MAWIWFLVAVVLFFILGSVEQANQKTKKELEELRKDHAALKAQQELQPSTRGAVSQPVVHSPPVESAADRTLNAVATELQSFLTSQIQKKRRHLQRQMDSLELVHNEATAQQGYSTSQQGAELQQQMEGLVTPVLSEVRAGFEQGLVRSTLDHLAQSVEDFQGELTAEKEKHQATQRRVSDLLTQLEEARSALQQLQLEVESSSHSREIADIQRRLVELEQQVQTKSEELTRITQKLADTYSLEGPLLEISQVNEQLQTKAQQLESLTERLTATYALETPLLQLEQLHREIAQREDQLASLKAELVTWTPFSEATTALKDLQVKIGHKKNEIVDLEEEIDSLEKDMESLRYDLVPQEFGLYEPKYDFKESARFKDALKEVREEQKSLIRSGYAIVKPINWQVNDSIAAGMKMVERFSKLQLRAFNGECEGYILKVRFDNVEATEQKIHDLYRRVNKMSGDIGCYISEDYLQLKIDELHLAHEYQERKQAEKIEQLEIREQIREEKKALAEAKKAEEQAALEAAYYERALQAARQEFEVAEGKLREEMTLQLRDLEAKLEEARARGERALSMAQQTRAGHVYVISNIGSFGENVYKIGMTRRLDPLERVRELGGASVPFHFDVHAIISSPDAPKLEAELHRAFEPYRINKVNPRKEFFRVTLEEIERVVRENHGDIEFTLAAEAHDYRQSRALALQA